MATADQELIEISVLAGQTQQASVFLHPGVTMNPASVGASGDWSIVAEGVAGVHVFIAFDGKDVFAAVAPNLTAVLAGSLLTTQWMRAPVPCELRFAGACLVLRKVTRDPAGDEPLASTMHDGGALLKAAQRAVDVAMRAKARGHGEFESTAMMPEAPREGGARPADGMPPSTLRMTDRPLSPFDLRPPGQPAPPRPPFGSSPGVSPANAVNAPNEWGAAGPADYVLPQLEGGVKVATRDKGVKAYWKAASPVKKLSLILMPFALALSYLMLVDPPPSPAELVTTGASAPAKASGTAPGSPSASARSSAPVSTASSIPIPRSSPEVEPPSASPGPSATPSAVAAPPVRAPKSVAKAPAGRRTPERNAIDAAAEGSFDAAAKQYATLATAHPETAVYKEAARILADKAATR